MGWGSGAALMSEVIAAIKPNVADEEARKGIYRILINAFEDMDWDTQQDCEGEDPAFDAVLSELHHHWYEKDKP